MPKSPEPHPTGAQLSPADRRLLALSWNETVTALSAGLTHDLCNAMTGIVSLSEVLLNVTGADEKTRKALAQIRDTGLNAAQLAQRVYRLQQDAPGQKNFLDLNQEIASHAALLQKLLTRRTPIRTTLEPGQLPVEADPIELRQVVLNVAVDCAKAMPKEGRLVFRTARVHSPPSHAAFKSTTFSHDGQSWVQLMIQQSVQTEHGARPERSTPVDPNAWRDAFLSRNSKEPSGLGIWRAVLFAERHAAALAIEADGCVLQLWLPCVNLANPTA
jgi:hypothetical protein